MRNRKSYHLFIIGAGILITAAAYAMLPTTSDTHSDSADSTPLVATVAATRENIATRITLNAELRPYQEADLHAKVAGYLKTLTVDIGDQVRTGQTLATLDTQELKSDVSHAQADFHNAQLDYNRIAEVAKQKPGLLAQAEVDKSRANYEMSKAALERARAFYDYANITAPFDGVITKRYVAPGALIQASTTSSTQTLPIVHLAQNTVLRLDVAVPEAAVPFIHVGSPATITVQATGQTINATIARTAGSIDSATRTMEAELDIANTDLRITPGMYATAAIDLAQKDNALTLPVQAVQLGDKPNVWIINAQQKLEERPITIGLQTPEKVEILQGISEGEQVVFGSRASLSLNQIVQPKPISVAEK